MYRFVDTIERPDMIQTLPTEAVSINTRYLEHIIEGYRTLSVSGRETMEADVSEVDDGVTHGTRFVRRKYRPRTITVKYQLRSKDSGAFRVAYNKLKAMLSVSQAAFIFNDEKDKFFVGTPKNISAVDDGRNFVIGEWEIYCNDPFKRDLRFTVHECVAGTMLSYKKDGGIITSENGNVLIGANNVVVGNGGKVDWYKFGVNEVAALYSSERMGGENFYRVYRGTEIFCEPSASAAGTAFTYKFDVETGYETEIVLIIAKVIPPGETTATITGVCRDRISGKASSIITHHNAQSEGFVEIDGIGHKTTWTTTADGGDGVLTMANFPTILPGTNSIKISNRNYLMLIAYRGRWL